MSLAHRKDYISIDENIAKLYFNIDDGALMFKNGKAYVFDYAFYNKAFGTPSFV